MTNEKRKVYLVDGSAYIFRAYYAIRQLSTKAGFPTNALYGFTRMLLKLLSQADSEHTVMVFDSGRKTFRNDLYPLYKANRDECPDDLRQQMPFFRDISRALGLRVTETPGFEADDVIATLCKRLSDAGIETVIVTGDKDLMQLVDKQVTIWDTMKDKRYDAKGVKEKMGVDPDQVVELLGLMGDSSDNIPGLSGVGPKTAIQLVEKYGSVQTILNSIEEIKNDKSIRGRNKIAEQLETDPEILKVSRRLVEVSKESPVELTSHSHTVSIENLSSDELFEALKRQQPDSEKLNELVERFEFQSLLTEFSVAGVGKGRLAEQEGNKYRTVYAGEFADWLSKLGQQHSFSFDLETTSLDPLKASIVGIAVCFDEEEAFYIPVGHVSSEATGEQVSCEVALDALRPILENPDVRKVGQNLKYDISVLARQGVLVRGVWFDTMIASYLMHPDRGGHGLDALVNEHLGFGMISYKEVTEGVEDFAQVSIEQATLYACEDAHAAWLLARFLEPKLLEMELADVFNTIEMPLVGVLSRMELQGVNLDTAFLSEMSKELGAKIKELEAQIFANAGIEFNLNSPKQLSDVLFNQLGISTKGLKKTKTGISTDSSVLERLKSDHTIPGMILEYRGLHKLKSTYVDALPAQVSPITGRLHTRFNQVVTGTGRLSSSDPNLQNIPIQSAEGRRVRKAFRASSGHLLISADYSQIELRLLAHMSGDQNLIEAFQNDQDIHANTARELLCPGSIEEVSPEMRRIGKTINFGIVYGMSGFRLARELGLPVQEGNRYIENYFAYYSGVQRFFKEIEEESLKQGYVTTMFGRRRYLADIDSSGRDSGFLRRVAINAPIQGTAADVIKLAMVRLEKRLEAERLPLSMVLQIHDELVFEVEEDHVEEMLRVVKDEMEGVVSLSVPLKVDAGFGPTWHEAH